MRHLLFQIPLDDLSDSDLHTRLSDQLAYHRGAFMITTPNPEFFLRARKDSAFKRVLQSADLSLPDGVGLRFAVAALTDGYLGHRQTGVDLVGRLLKMAYQEHKHVLVIDGLTHSATRYQSVVQQLYPGISYATHDPGIVTESSVESIVQFCLQSDADMVFVALGHGKQEFVMERIKSRVQRTCLFVGVGGAFDMLVSDKPRAPIWMRRWGIEWVWRLIIEPKRWLRIIDAVVLFPGMVVYATLRQKRFLYACQRVFQDLVRHFRSV